MLVGLWIRKQGLWVFMPCDDKRWHTQQQHHFFLCTLPSLNSCSESSVLITSFSPFHYLVSLQTHETHPMKQKITFVKKINLHHWDSRLHGKDWAQEEEESSCNTHIFSWLKRTHTPEQLYHWVLACSTNKKLQHCNRKFQYSPLCITQKFAWEPKLQFNLKYGFGPESGHRIFYSSFAHSLRSWSCWKGCMECLLAGLC